MFNLVVLTGRLAQDPEFKQLSNDQCSCTITLCVNRPYKNSQGTVDVDFVKTILWDVNAKNCNQYCKKGDQVLIRGHLQNYQKEIAVVEKDKDPSQAIDKKYNFIQVVTEKIIFLGANRRDANVVFPD